MTHIVLYTTSETDRFLKDDAQLSLTATPTLDEPSLLEEWNMDLLTFEDHFDFVAQQTQIRPITQL